MPSGTPLCPPWTPARGSGIRRILTAQTLILVKTQLGLSLSSAEAVLLRHQNYVKLPCNVKSRSEFLGVFVTVSGCWVQVIVKSN